MVEVHWLHPFGQPLQAGYYYFQNPFFIHVTGLHAWFIDILYEHDTIYTWTWYHQTSSIPIHQTQSINCLACRQWLKDCAISEGGQPKPKSKGTKNPKKPLKGSNQGGKKKPAKGSKKSNQSNTGGKPKVKKTKPAVETATEGTAAPAKSKKSKRARAGA